MLDEIAEWNSNDSRTSESQRVVGYALVAIGRLLAEHLPALAHHTSPE
jgi:hypothetical protein